MSCLSLLIDNANVIHFSEPPKKMYYFFMSEAKKIASTHFRSCRGLCPRDWLVNFRTANLLTKNESYTGNLVKNSKDEPVAVIRLRHVAHCAAVDVLEYLDEV